MKNNFLKFGFICLVLSVAAQAAPKWKNYVIDLTAQEGVAFSLDLASLVENKSGDPLTFAVDTPPAFLSLSSAGLLSGTPARADVGEYKFRASVIGGDGGSLAVVHFKVLKKPEVQIVTSLTCESGEKALFLGRTNSGDSIYSCANPANN